MYARIVNQLTVLACSQLCKADAMALLEWVYGLVQVSFGIHDTEEEAARQYDRALIIEKGRAAKTNFPLAIYDDEVAAFETFVTRR